MYNKKELVDEINYIIEKNDNERLKILIEEISNNYSFRWFDLIEDVFLDDELDSKTKLDFCLRAMEYRKDHKEGLDNLFTRQVVPYLLLKSIKEDKEYFSKLLNESNSIQELIIDYFKQDPDDAIEVWEQIHDLPLTKKEILDDEEFVAENLRNEESFFNKLPEGYEHLICYYNPEFNEIDFNYIQLLYKQYFGDRITQKQQLKLIALQYYLKKEDGISPTALMQPINYILKEISTGEGFFERLEKLEQNTQLDFISTAILTYHYRDSRLLDELIENEKLDDETKEKLSYLCKNNRIKEINSIADLQNATIEELDSMEKEVLYVSNAFGRGGPGATTIMNVLPDSRDREIRRIDADGKTSRMEVGYQDSHGDVVERIYSEDVQFPDSCKTVFNRSIEAAKQISSVTLVIEYEQCHMYMPSNISNEQIEQCTELIESAIDNGKFGIAVYDRERDKAYITGVDLLDKKEAKSFVTILGEKNRIQRNEQDNTNKEEEDER